MSSPACPGNHPVRIALFLETTNNYWRGIIRGIARFSQPRPSRVLRLPDPRWTDICAIKADSPDAIVAAVSDAQTADALLSLGKPVLNVSFFEDARMAKVGNDDHAIGVLGAEHLLRCG